MDTKKIGHVGWIATARVVGPKDGLILVSAMGMVLRISVTDVPQIKRGVWNLRDLRGSRIMELSEEDRLASMTRLVASTRKASPRSGSGSEAGSKGDGKSKKNGSPAARKKTSSAAGKRKKSGSTKSRTRRETSTVSQEKDETAPKAAVGPTPADQPGHEPAETGSAGSSGEGSGQATPPEPATPLGQAAAKRRPGALPPKKPKSKRGASGSAKRGKKRPLTAGPSGSKS